MIHKYKDHLLFTIYILIINLSYIFLLKQKSPTQDVWNTFIIFSLIINASSILIFYFNNIFKENILKKFVFTLLIYGSIGVFITPLFGTPDEPAHYLRTYEIYSGHLFTEVRDNLGGREMPENISKVINSIDIHNLHYSTILEQINIPIDSDKTVFCSFTNTALYSPIQYIPQAIGMFITGLFTNKVILVGYGGRIANFLCSFMLYFFALKALPKLSRYLFLIIFMPMNLQLMTSLSSDTLTSAVSTLLFCLVIKNTHFSIEKQIKFTTKLAIFMLCITVSLCKIVYLPICLLILIIPTIKFKNLTQKIIYILSTAFSCIFLNLSWLIYSKRFLVEILENVHPDQQIIYILQNPIKFLLIIATTISYDAQDWLQQMIGYHLNWLNNTLPSIFIIIFILLIFYYLTVDNSIRDILNKNEVILISIIILCCLFLIHISLYIQWNEVFATKIRGIQGRYFIPILCLIPAIFGKKYNNDEAKLNKLLSNSIIYMYSPIFLHCLLFNLI